MARTLLITAAGLAIAAMLAQSVALLTPAILLALAVLLGRAWAVRASMQLRSAREMPERAFLDDTVELTVSVHNAGFLPVPWLTLSDSIPANLSALPFERVVSLRPYERRAWSIAFRAAHRGLYEIGPLRLGTGDVLGLSDNLLQSSASRALTVYPRMVPVARLGLPSRTLLGHLRHAQPIADDPARLRGRRDYAPGDTLRRIDWKASASAARLQVKQYEPTRSVELILALDLDMENYDRRTWVDDAELAIVVTASIGRWAVEQGESVGLLTNGRDPGATSTMNYMRPATALPAFAPVAARAGRAAFTRVLDVLARVRPGDPPAPDSARSGAFADLIRRARSELAWGATLAMISGDVSPTLLAEAAHMRAAGISPLFIVCGGQPGIHTWRARAGQLGIPMHVVASLRELAP